MKKVGELGKTTMLVKFGYVLFSITVLYLNLNFSL